MFGRSVKKGKMGIEGVGPLIMVPAAIVFVVEVWLSYAYKPAFDIPLPGDVLAAAGIVLLVPGLLLWAWSMATFLPHTWAGAWPRRGNTPLCSTRFTAAGRCWSFRASR